MPDKFSPSEFDRYARHLTLPEVGIEGQARLKGSRVLIVGAGGLGSPAAMYLAAAGVGRIGLLDFDCVALSNLQRQLLYRTADAGRPKLEAARETLVAINPHIEIVSNEVRLGVENAMELLAPYDLIIDGTDNFETRYLVNDACVLLGKPNIHGSVYRFEGEVSVFAAQGGPCYRCMHPEPPAADAIPDCAQGGVLGVLPGLIGILQATEAIKLLLGIGEPLVGKVLCVDALAMRFRTLRLARNPDCPVCGENPATRELRPTGAACPFSRAPTITAEELQERFAGDFGTTIIDVREPAETAAGSIPGALLIPLGRLATRLNEIPPHQEIIVYCRAGTRGARAAWELQASGFDPVFNLDGGIEGWRGPLEIAPRAQRAAPLPRA